MKQSLPIAHWSYSSLLAYLRNPLAWYKRYVEKIYDMPSSPSAVVGRAGHYALEHFYKGVSKEEAVERGLSYIQDIPDFEIDFGKACRRRTKRQKRESMEETYKRAISFYLARPPRHKVLGVEVRGLADIKGLSIPIKAISDLVVHSRVDKGALDIVDHKFVDTFSAYGGQKTLFVLQAIFNYHTVKHVYGKPVKRFIVQECKKTKNKDGKSQMRRYSINYDECEEAFTLFHRLLKDATDELASRKVYLPNPSDMFEGENSFDIYRLGLLEG